MSLVAPRAVSWMALRVLRVSYEAWSWPLPAEHSAWHVCVTVPALHASSAAPYPHALKTVCWGAAGVCWLWSRADLGFSNSALAVSLIVSVRVSQRECNFQGRDVECSQVWSRFCSRAGCVSSERVSEEESVQTGEPRPIGLAGWSRFQASHVNFSRSLRLVCKHVSPTDSEPQNELPSLAQLPELLYLRSFELIPVLLCSRSERDAPSPWQAPKQATQLQNFPE